MNNKIRLMIVDDQVILSGGMELLLTKTGRYEVVSKVENMAEVLPSYKKFRPEIVILDIRFDKTADNLKSGLDVLKTLILLDKNAKIIMHSQYDHPETIQQAYASGAKAFINKNIDLERFISVIEEVASGKVSLPPEIAQKLAMLSIAPKTSANPKNLLNKRQLEIFVLMAQGNTQSEIAGIMSLHKRTITAETARIKDLLGVERPAQITMMAIEHGLISASSITSWGQP